MGDDLRTTFNFDWNFDFSSLASVFYFPTSFLNGEMGDSTQIAMILAVGLIVVLTVSAVVPW